MYEESKRKKGASPGFTMIELVIVVIIIGLMAGLVTPAVMRRLDSSKQNTTLVQIEGFSGALDGFRLDVGRYPTTQEGLQALREKPATNAKGWVEPYLRKEIPLDSWGNKYVYKSPGAEGRKFEIISYGADGKEGGEGFDQDLVSWRGLKQ